MDRKIWLLFLTLITGMLWIAGCSPVTKAIPTVMPSATMTLTPTRVSTATQAPTLTVEQHFQESVRHWQVAYYDRALDQLCAMYADGSDKVCLDFDQYPDTYVYGATASSPDGTYGAYYGGASWSPDGSRLVFDMDLHGIYIWEVGSGFAAFRDGRVGLLSVPSVAYGSVQSSEKGSRIRRINASYIELTEEHRTGPASIRVFIPTDSSSPICLVTLSEASFPVPGMTVFCAPRVVDGVAGVNIHIFYPVDLPDQFVVSLRSIKMMRNVMVSRCFTPGIESLRAQDRRDLLGGKIQYGL